MKLLVADDSATVRAFLATSLRGWGFDVAEAVNGEDAWRQLQAPDAARMALLDWEMPGKNGIDVCRLVRERELGGAAYTYVLLLTARHEKQSLLGGLDAGADDYVVKPFDADELRARLRAGQRIIAMETELLRLKEEFRQQSRTDALTGCLNRRAVMERLAAELARAAREARPVGVALLDVDHFKRINDVHGHAAGDAVLCELVRRVQAGMRASDVLGRFGGEEFLVLCPEAGLDGDGARVAGERLRRLVDRAPFDVGGAELHVTASVGVTVTSARESPEAVVARADAALYAAKAGGRNRVEVSPPAYAPVAEPAAEASRRVA